MGRMVLAENYVHMVVKSKNGVDLFSLDSLLRMCQIEQEFIQARFYKDLCLTNKKQKCCRPWSLANYIALLQNRTSCLALTVNIISRQFLFEISEILLS